MKFRVITHTLDNNMKPIENSKKVYDIGEFKDMSAAVELKNTAISKGFNNTHIINSL